MLYHAHSRMPYIIFHNTLLWRHNERDGDLNQRCLDGLLNRLFWRTPKKKIKLPRHWTLSGESTSDRWIPLTKGQLQGKCFHLITQSWIDRLWDAIMSFPSQHDIKPEYLKIIDMELIVVVQFVYVKLDAIMYIPIGINLICYNFLEINNFDEALK